MGTTRFAQNDLARLSYEVAGPVDAPVVVLLHATLTDRISFAPLRDCLDGAARVLVPDARGHGASSALTDRSYSSTDMANDVVAILDAEGVRGPVHLVGHGQGAVAALEVAHWRPDRLASLVLIEPDALCVLDGEDDADVIAAREEARSASREASDQAYKGLADRALSRYLDRRWGRGWAERLPRPRLAAVRRSVQALSPSLDAVARFRILPEHLAPLTVPALVVTGEDSPAAEREVAARLAAWIPGAETLTVPSLPGGTPFAGDGDAAGAVAAWVREKMG
ncbi:MAG TPA: alpha/beta hydrolase [Thermomicrobiales bacterium]|nr:alpha/beta hydrolase [Thermomicrobiales bacterium]